MYCLVPYELAGDLHEPLRRHFRDEPDVQVVVERRTRERRARSDRRDEDQRATRERRSIRNIEGRRIEERRAAVASAAARELPRKARRHAERLSFVVRVEPADDRAEDVDTARLVTKFQAGDSDAFVALYMRYFDRVFGYLRVVLKDRHEAEDATQHVFAKVFEALPRYERRAQPFRSWLFTVVRNHALNDLKKKYRLDIVVDPAEMARTRDAGSLGIGEELSPLEWITDSEVLLFVERLPLPQRQVLMLRFMLDLTDRQIATVLDRTPSEVRVLQYRALQFLRQRLAALGRTPRDLGRVQWRTRVRQAPVIRSRRFALTR